MVTYWHNTDYGSHLVPFREVWVDDAPLGPTGRAYSCSPTGYGWGYGGSGPAALAHSILSHATGSTRTADEYCQRFKRHHVATWGDGWRITQGAVLRWLEFQRAGIGAPQVWQDCPPEPIEELGAFLSEVPLAVYCDIARLAYWRAYGVLGDLLEEHGRPREWAPRICANLPESWLEDAGPG